MFFVDLEVILTVKSSPITKSMDIFYSDMAARCKMTVTGKIMILRIAWKYLFISLLKFLSLAILSFFSFFLSFFFFILPDRPSQISIIFHHYQII